MSPSGRKKYKHEKGNALFEDHLNGGTAARTRPFSFDEIMLRRKSKKESGNVEDPPERATITGKATSVKQSAHEESSRHRHNDFRTSSGKLVSDESVKVTSRRKEDDTSIKEKKRMKVEEKGNQEVERKAKGTLTTSNSGDKAKGSRNYRLTHDKRKDELSDDSGKRDSKVSIFKDRHADERRGASEIGSRKNKEYEDDKRTRDQNAAKKYDSQKRHDSEFPERKEKKEATQSRHDDSRSKRRRSRSREHDREKSKRSLSPAPERKEKKEAPKSRHEDSEFSERKEKKVAAESRHDDSKSKRRRSRSREHDKEKGRMSLSPAPKKKEKKEAPKSRHEDSKSKRRRSRSREHTKEKNRRSHSPSPRGHKGTSYDTRDHGELTTHSTKDKSGRSNSSIDRTRMQLNGSSNQSRRHGTSTNRLGGYSPRKRRSEAAIKTPSPTSRSPEKKNAGWDFPPVEAESNYPGSVLSKLESSNQTVPLNEPELSSVVTVPSTSSNPKPILEAVSSIPSLMIKSSIDSIQLTQATRPKRRLYVENLPSSASEEAVMEWINSYLLSSGGNHIQGTNPCISCIIHKEKGQALVEFLTPEDASAALSFDGRTFSGTILKIRRPKDYTEVTTGIPEKSVAAVDSVRDIVEDSPHKIFIGGISKLISSEMLKEIVSAFGHLKAYHFETNMDPNGSCAFLEYVDPSVTSKACSGLNGMRLGGQVLTVTLAVTEDLSVPENLGYKPFYGIPDHAKPLLEKPTQVLKLCNVLDPNSLSSLSESELEEILEDIRLECARFGTVKSINSVRPIQCSATSTEACGDTKNTNSAVDEENHDDKRTEKEGMDLDRNIGRSLESSVSLVNEELEEVEKLNEDVQAEESNGSEISEESQLKKDPDELDEDVQANDTCDSAAMVDSAVDQEILPNAFNIELSTPVDDALNGQENLLANKNIIKTEDHETENKVLVLAELKTENENGNIEKELDIHSVSTEGLESREHESNMKDVFDPGCVLVEYRRTEASSIAAHCLHGRLFDNRTITVEYIPHDLYCARFPK